MDKIKEFLNVKNINNIKRIKENYVELGYEVRTTKKASSDLLINYLTTYPLFSSKLQDFLDWEKHIKLEYQKAINYWRYISINIPKNSMNTKRTQYNWDSLSRFYC